MVNTEDYEVGVIVGRFQLAELHDGHQFLIDTVVNNHKKSIIFLGVPKAIGTPEDPIRIPSTRNILDFQSRMYMIQEKYPNTVVLSVQDKDDDEVWSKQVDTKIREIFPTEKILLYGGRDSFIPYYKGVFQTKSLDPKIYQSATMQRNNISKEVLNDPNFRKGQIYYAYQQTPMLYTNYKIAITEGNDKILFSKKDDKSKLTLLSGLAGINDPSLEIGAKRVIGNLVGSIETETFYEMSSNNIDFGNKANRIVNVLISAKKKFGSIQPNGNFTTEWVSIESLLSEGFMVKNVEKEDFTFVQHLIAKMR